MYDSKCFQTSAIEDQHANLAGHKAHCSTLNPQFNILIDGHDCFPYLCNELGIKWYIQPILWGGRDTCLPIQVCCLELVSPCFLQSLNCQRRPCVVNRRQLLPRIICSAALRGGPPAESQGFLCFDPDSKVRLLLIDI